MLIQKSTKFNIDLNALTNYGWTAFHSACFGQSGTVVEMMIDNAEFFKLDLAKKTVNGRTGFQIAKSHRYYDIVHIIERKMPSIAL